MPSVSGGNLADPILTGCLRGAIAADLPLVRGDARRPRRVLLNLQSNAVKFTPKGGATMLSPQRAAPKSPSSAPIPASAWRPNTSESRSLASARSTTDAPAATKAPA